MLGEIPKLFGRGFVIGYLLPATIFLAYLTYGIALDVFGVGAVSAFTVAATARASVGLIIMALALLLLNRPFVRILEGYYRFNPLRQLESRERERFGRIAEPVDKEWRALEQAWSKDLDISVPAGLGRRAALAARSFPHRIELVLGTRFGNSYRAYETNPNVLYGMDAVVLWPRLVCLLPAAAQDQLQESRAKLDFHVNMLWLSFLATLIALGAWNAWSFPWCAIPPALSTMLLWYLLPASARSWGITFSSMFDLYRARLAKSLGLELPATLKEERTMWQAVGQAILYRHAYTADFLDAYRIGRPSTGSPTEEPNPPS
jgi:hypothetical protein